MTRHGTRACYQTGCKRSECRAAQAEYMRNYRAGIPRVTRPLTGCPACDWGPENQCDDHQIPSVCICPQPRPNAGGECATCQRPYKPEVPGFDACREAWLAQLRRGVAV